MENHIEREIKMLIIDNDGEFSKNEFGEFCKRYRIERKKMTPDTPQTKPMDLQKE